MYFENLQFFQPWQMNKGIQINLFNGVIFELNLLQLWAILQYALRNQCYVIFTQIPKLEKNVNMHLKNALKEIRLILTNTAISSNMKFL